MQVNEEVKKPFFEGILKKMGRSPSVSENEKAKIVKLLAAKVETVHIEKRLKRDHRAIK